MQSLSAVLFGHGWCFALPECGLMGSAGMQAMSLGPAGCHQQSATISTMYMDEHVERFHLTIFAGCWESAYFGFSCTSIIASAWILTSPPFHSGVVSTTSYLHAQTARPPSPHCCCCLWHTHHTATFGQSALSFVPSLTWRPWGMEGLPL